MEVRQNLIRLCEKINDGLYKITPDCAEYRVFEKWITDEQINVMLALTSMKPAFVPFIARKAKMSVKRTKEVLHEITKIGLVVQVIVPKVGMEIYLLPPSMEELERRLRGRGTDPEEVIRKRLARAREELAELRDGKTVYDYYVVNHTVEQAAAEIEEILNAENRSRARRMALPGQLLNGESIK